MLSVPLVSDKTFALCQRQKNKDNAPSRPNEKTMIDIFLPQPPICWETCGNCAGELIVSEVCVAVGDFARRDDTLIVLETNKVALDIPMPRDGVVREILVREGDIISENSLIARIEENK